MNSRVQASMADEKAVNRRRLAAASVLFFLSGACALTYEVVWARMFGISAGGNTAALTTVLTAYMSGLCLGSFAGGRLADRWLSRPALAYGLCEVLIGASAAGLTLLVPRLTPVFRAGHDLFSGGALFEAYRFAVCALVMLVPTSLMGATFPIMVRGFISGRENFARISGTLYAANTLGACGGALLAGFLLVPHWGHLRAALAAAVANAGILAAVLVLPGLSGWRAPAPPAPPAPTSDASGGGNRAALLLLLGGYGLSGLAAMIYQVGWARALALSLGNSTYALSIILAAYIGGLFLGGAAMSGPADRRRAGFGWAAGLEFAIALTALLVIPLFERVTLAMFGWTQAAQEDFHRASLLRFGVAFGLVLLPTAAMGALLPVTVRIAGRLTRGAGEAAGYVYAANTAGAIVGAALAAHFFIRSFGLRGALVFGRPSPRAPGCYGRWRGD